MNPCGSVEAIFTHAISSLSGVPAAHAPMLESRTVEDIDVGVVDPGMAVEAVSGACFVCVLKGRRRSPQPDARGPKPVSITRPPTAERRPPTGAAPSASRAP